MKRKTSLFLMTLFVFSSSIGTALAVSCSGNACDKLSVQKRGGCVVFVNSSDRQIEAQIVAYVYQVYAHSDETPKADGQCWTNIVGVKANYK